MLGTNCAAEILGAVGRAQLVTEQATAVLAADVGLHWLEADQSAVTKGGEQQKKNCEVREPLHSDIL